jgi:hypothetical protein
MDTHVVAFKSSPRAAQKQERRVIHRPHPEHEDDLRRSIEQADRGELLDPETTEAYLRWLETGEGPCPIDESQG